MKKRTGILMVGAAALMSLCFAGYGQEQQSRVSKANGTGLAEPQPGDELPYWRSIRQGDVGAYMDHTGKVVLTIDLNVIPKGAMQLFDFGTEPVARMRHGRLRWGLVDRSGKIIVEPKYEDMGLPAFGVVPVQLYERWGLLDYQGNEVLPTRYLKIETFSDGLGKVWATPAQVAGEWPDDDAEERASELLGKVHDRIPANRHVAVQELLKIGEPLFETRAFSTEATRGALIKNKNTQLGNLLRSITSLGRRSAKYGYISPKGEFVIEPRFGLAGSFQDGRAYVYSGGTRGYIDRRGERVFEGRGDGFNSGLARLVVDGRALFVNDQGQTVIEPAEGQVFPMTGFSEGRARFKQAGKYGFIDTKGQVVIEAKYELAWNFSDGLAIVRRGHGENREFAYIDRAGELAIPWRRGRSCYSFEGGLAQFKDNSTGYKVINKQGELVYDSGVELLWSR